MPDTKRVKGFEEYTAAEIVKLVDDKRRSPAFEQLQRQMQSDFELLSLTPFVAEEGCQAYTSPAPLNDFNKVLTGINKAALTWAIKLPEDAPEGEREKATKGEGLITGILDRVDRERRKVSEPPLRNSVGWMSCGRGCLGLKCLLYSDEEADGEFTIDIDVIDPLWMVWEKGVKEYIWIADLYHVSKAEAKERWGIDLGDDNNDGVVVNFWTRKLNAVVVYSGSVGENGPDRAEFVKEPTAHGLTHPPIFVGFAGSVPSIRDINNQLALKQRAMSVYAASRQVYTPRNKQLSFWMDIQERSVAGTLTYESDDGKKMIQGNPFGSWKVIPIKKGEKIQALEPPKAPPESAAVFQALNEDLQRSTIPFPIGYGLDPEGGSGRRLEMLNDNTRSVYDPFTSLQANAYQWLCEEILGQFKAKGEKMKLQGFNPSGTFFTVEADPDDIEDGWYIEVKCEPKLPRDQASEIQMAIAARQPRPTDGTPLLDDLTIREDILKVQDPDAIKTRLEDQEIEAKIRQMPNIQIRKMAEALVKKGDRKGAIEVLQSAPAPVQGAAGGMPPPEPGTGGPPPPEGMPPGGMAGGPGGQPSPEEIIMQVAQTLGLPPEQVASMPAQQVKAMLEQKGVMIA